jgi:hypothetical protein
LFREFVEDYNTCTLPHRRFYDLSAYARLHPPSPRHHAAGAEGSGIFLNDEQLRRAELQAERRQAEGSRAREAMTKMMLSKEHLSELKQREMIRLQAQDAYKTGDMGKAQRLMKRLNPNEEDARDLDQY